MKGGMWSEGRYGPSDIEEHRTNRSTSTLPLFFALQTVLLPPLTNLPDIDQTDYYTYLQ